MLFAALTVYVFATNSQVIWLYLIASLIGGLALVGLLGPWVVIRRVRPRLDGLQRRGFDPPLARDRDRVFAGDTVTLVVDLGQDRAPVEMGPLRVAGRPEQQVSFRIDGSRALVEVNERHRGRADYREILASSSWPLGIARAWRWIEIDRQVVVHPRYMLPREDRRQGVLEPVGSSATRGAGDEFLGLREYRSGDSQRRIHWPTSARTGVLMVVETAQESSNSTTYELILDSSTPEAADLAVGIAASLGAGNVAAGIPMAMAIPGQGQGVHRWEAALAALALAEPGQSSPVRPGHEAVRVTAEHQQVTVSRAGGAQVIDASLSLADAMLALGPPL
ncbi:MAG: DUF58 domain-containing protein [Candidatus Dormibacteria bacterium]